jgi:uncharacterized protein with HEPN domain
VSPLLRRETKFLASDKPIDRLRDVIENCDRIARHIAGMSRDAYTADEKTVDAVERCLQRISEAAQKLGGYLDQHYPDAPWKAARGIGNILRHKYDEVTDDSIWGAIENHLPRLRAAAVQEIERLRSLQSDDARGNRADMGHVSFISAHAAPPGPE